MRRGRSIALGTTLLGGVALIELRRLGLVPTAWDALPTVHLVAIAWTVTVLLVFEIVEMILALGRSFSETVARHLQVYSLVLLRDAFAELSHFPEPVAVALEDLHALGVMGADAAGAIALFAAAVWFRRLQRHAPITADASAVDTFRAIKKSIAFVMLLVFAALLGGDVAMAFRGRSFDLLFTVLIFVDVLLAIVSLGFTDMRAIIFRNFGFAFAAILLRLAIASPEFIRPALGVAAAIVAIAVTFAFNFATAGREPGVEPQSASD